MYYICFYYFFHIYLLVVCYVVVFFFFSSRRRHTRLQGDWSSDVCSSDLVQVPTRVHSVESRYLLPEIEASSGRPCRSSALSATRPRAVERLERGKAREIGRASCRERG